MFVIFQEGKIVYLGEKVENSIWVQNLNELRELFDAHLKEWNEWKMKDWIKAGIVAIIVLIVLKVIIVPGA